MKCYLSAVCVFSVLVALSCAAPMPQSDQSGGSNTRLQTTNIVEGINSKIRLLRQYCPQIFQVIDNVIQNVTSTAFRVIGRAVLQSGGLGGGSRSSGGGSTSKVTVVLPTFPPDEDYDDEENTNEVGGSSSTTTTESSPSELSREKRDVRVVRAAEAQQSDDQETAASGGNGPNPSDDLSNVDADDADRDKRYLPFGGSFGGHASGGHAGGGSGNFLFDIIRLVAGSGATEESDEKDNSPAGPGGVAEIDVAKGADGYTEGVPGPITRLFVLANRGLANLVQDLILRLAQTSERIVNFKARLVTALI